MLADRASGWGVRSVRVEVQVGLLHDGVAVGVRIGIGVDCIEAAGQESVGEIPGEPEVGNAVKRLRVERIGAEFVFLGIRQPVAIGIDVFDFDAPKHFFNGGGDREITGPCAVSGGGGLLNLCPTSFGHVR